MANVDDLQTGKIGLKVVILNQREATEMDEWTKNVLVKAIAYGINGESVDGMQFLTEAIAYAFPELVDQAKEIDWTL